MSLRLYAGHSRRTDIKGQSASRQPQGGKVSIRIVQSRLEFLRDGRQFLQLRNGGSIHFLNSFVGGIGIDLRQDGISDGPIVISALDGSRSPVVRAPEAGGGHETTCILTRSCEMLPTRTVARRIIFAPGEIENLASGSRQSRGSARELALVLIVHLHGFAEHSHGLSSRHPVEITVEEKLVISLECRQIMPVSVAMSLREHLAGIISIDHTVDTGLIILLNIIV